MKKFIMFSVVAFLPLLVSAATLSSTLNIGSLFEVAGGNTNVSSSCGTSGANSTVSFALLQNGSYTQLSTNLPTDFNGAFSGNVSFPSAYHSGSAILVATCARTGDIINSPLLTFAEQASTSFNLPSVLPTVGGIYNLSGACGHSNGTGNVQLTLISNGNNYQLDTANLSLTGTFSQIVVIPNNISTGPATIKAVCSNGTTFSSSVDLGPIAVNSFDFGSSPFPGSNTAISGNCTNVSSNQNGLVTFSALRSGTNSNLPATNNSTNNNGFFNAYVSFPSNLGSNPATFVVTCPNGSTYSNVIMLGSAGPAVLAAETAPVGGVNAGTDPQDKPGYLASAGVLLVVGLLGLFAVLSRGSYVQK